MQNPLWEKSKPFVIQIGFLAVIGLVGWFGVRLLLSNIQTKMDDIQKLSVTRQHREQQLERLPDLEAQHALIGEHNDQLNIILTKDRLVEFIETLERLALSEHVIIEIESRDNAFLESKVTTTDKKEAAVKAQAIQSADKENAASDTTKRGTTTKETGIVAELPLKKFLKLTITVTGEYGNIVRYLQRMETLPYALDIIRLNIKERSADKERIDPGSAALNPFGESPAVQPPLPQKNVVLDAVFETVVYMKD